MLRFGWVFSFWVGRSGASPSLLETEKTTETRRGTVAFDGIDSSVGLSERANRPHPPKLGDRRILGGENLPFCNTLPE